MNKRTKNAKKKLKQKRENCHNLHAYWNKKSDSVLVHWRKKKQYKSRNGQSSNLNKPSSNSTHLHQYSE